MAEESQKEENKFLHAIQLVCDTENKEILRVPSENGALHNKTKIRSKKNQKPKSQRKRNKATVQNDQLAKILNEELEKCAENDEINVLLKVLQLNVYDIIDIYRVIFKDLVDVIGQKYHKSFTISQFGSTLTGLAFKGNNIDIIKILV